MCWMQKRTEAPQGASEMGGRHTTQIIMPPGRLNGGMCYNIGRNGKSGICGESSTELCLDYWDLIK